MAKQKKSRFSFSTRSLKADAENDDVRSLQNFLTQTGYLKRDRHPGRMCGSTCDALRHFQKCYGLSVTGEADEETLALIERPRCGMPDTDPDEGSGSGPAPFVLRGCTYPNTDLTYAFVNSTPDLAVDRQREIIREAFDAWAVVSPLQFTEVAEDESPNFPISFERMDHGDGSPFDGSGTISGNVLAHAFYPPICGGAFAGALHFDEFETWTDAASPGAIRLLNVAIHEIGHLLGLAHSNVEDAIMFAFYDDNVDSLRQDDIDGIQEAYGPPQTAITGELTGDGDSQVHQLPVQPGRLIAKLRGPTESDFDLYARIGSPPTRSTFDARGFTASSNEEVRLDTNGEPIFVMVDSWRGRGEYELAIEVDGATP